MLNDRRDTKEAIGDRRRATVILKGFKGPLWVRENCRFRKLSINVSISKAPKFSREFGQRFHPSGVSKISRSAKLNKLHI